MTATVRLSSALDLALAEYCAKHGITRNAAIREAISRLVVGEHAAPFAYHLGHDLFGPATDRTPQDNVAANTARMLRERFRA